MKIMKGVAILAVAVAIGIYIMPHTHSIFMGKHDWYFLGNPGSDINCQKCHADIYEELELSPVHKKWGDATRADTSDCEACHRGNLSITYANASSATPGIEAHAASKTECMYCHGNTSIASFYGAPVAGGFGISDLPSDSGSNSTHLQLLIGSTFDSNVYPGESEACIFCHTSVGVKFNITTYRGFSLNVANKPSSLSDGWYVSSISPSSFYTYTEVK